MTYFIDSNTNNETSLFIIFLISFCKEKKIKFKTIRVHYEHKNELPAIVPYCVCQ